MNSQITHDLLRTFADAIRLYMRLTKEYRTCKNPTRKQDLKRTRAAAFHSAQEANQTLHNHLNQYPEPEFTRLQARKLIQHWDARETCYQNLIKRDPSDHPAEAIARLDRAEKALKKQLDVISEILTKIT